MQRSECSQARTRSAVSWLTCTHQAGRISPSRQDRRIVHAIESDIIHLLDQVSYLTHRIVRSILPSP